MAKGTLVREVDALDGLMGLAADEACVQFRLLGKERGPAGWGPRMQCDRELYQQAMTQLTHDVAGLSVVQGEAQDLILQSGRVAGLVIMQGHEDRTRVELRAPSVIIATGTFLRGRMLVGDRVTEGGRQQPGERPATLLAETLSRVGCRTARMKTGTPPRLDGNTIDFSKLKKQSSHAVKTFSHLNDADVWDKGSLLPCHITQTNPATHQLILDPLAKLPLFESLAPDGYGYVRAESSASLLNKVHACEAHIVIPFDHFACIHVVYIHT